MLITLTLLFTLIAQAQATPRLRQHYDLWDSAVNSSRWTLNAGEPVSVLNAFLCAKKKDVQFAHPKLS